MDPVFVLTSISSELKPDGSSLAKNVFLLSGTFLVMS